MTYSLQRSPLSGSTVIKRNLPIFTIFLLAAVVLPVNLIFAQLTIPSLKEYQVISRTSADKADYAVSGTCRSGTGKILLDLAGQDDAAVVAPRYPVIDNSPVIVRTSRLKIQTAIAIEIGSG